VRMPRGVGTAEEEAGHEKEGRQRSIPPRGSQRNRKGAADRYAAMPNVRRSSQHVKQHLLNPREGRQKEGKEGKARTP